MPGNAPKLYEILVHKGDVDLAAVERLLGAPEIDQEILLFHLQQAVEKYIKALLSFNNIHFEKTHDIIGLLDLCAVHQIVLPDYASEFELLYPYAVQGRYETIFSTEVDPAIFLKRIMEFKGFIHQTLGITTLKS